MQIQTFTLGNSQNGRLEVFAVSADGRPLHNRQIASGWSGWAPLGWHPLGGTQLRLQHVTTTRDKLHRLHVFAVGADNNIDRISQNSPNGDWESQWSVVAGPATYVSAGCNDDGTLEIFSVNRIQDLAIFRVRQVAEGGGWDPSLTVLALAPRVTQVEVAPNKDGRLEVFAIQENGSPITHLWQEAPGKWLISPAGVPPPGGVLVPYTVPGGVLLGNVGIRQFVVAINEDGRLEVFALNENRTISHSWQAKPNGNWTEWRPLGGGGHDLRHITAARSEEGYLAVFALGGDGRVYAIQQLAPNAGWGGWSQLPEGTFNLQRIASAPGRSGSESRLIVLGLTDDGRVFSSEGGPGKPYTAWHTIGELPGIPASTPPTILTASPLPSATAGQVYHLALQATGGQTPYVWSVSGGSVPAGIALDSVSGTVAGTPGIPTTATFTVKCAGWNTLNAEKEFNLVVQQPPPPAAGVSGSVIWPPIGTQSSVVIARFHGDLIEAAPGASQGDSVFDVEVSDTFMPGGAQASLSFSRTNLRPGKWSIWVTNSVAGAQTCRVMVPGWVIFDLTESDPKRRCKGSTWL